MFASNTSADGAANYIEDVFSTYLYTGNGSTQTITNGIDLSGKGGLTWIKRRDAVGNHNLFDTARGATKKLYSDLTNAEYTDAYSLTSFNSNGFSLGLDGGGNANGGTYASWTFRKQPKFFDVVTWTGTGSAQNIAHNLGSVPGCIIVKNLDALTNWAVYHRSLGGTYITRLNRDWASDTGYENWANTDPTSTVFTVGGGNATNGSGNNYVAYVFAHNAGGFGLTGTDNVISCGSYTGNGSSSGPTITLGYEPQWVMVKRTDSTSNWFMLDIMRGIPNTPGVAAGSAYLFANTSAAEDSAYAPFAALSATGFSLLTSNANLNDSGGTYIYIAIRRGPMKVPTSGTSVYNASVPSSTSAGQVLTSGFQDDLIFQKYRTLTASFNVADRLRGIGVLSTANTNAENTSQDRYQFDVQDGVELVIGDGAYSMLYYHFRRAPSFFDEVCYTGDGTNLAINHNLQAIPELIILKYRAGTSYGWLVTATGLTNPDTYYLGLNSTNAESNYTANLIYNRTSTTFTVASDLAQSGWNWVAYLFATCAGVSKVGSYTGTGTTKQIDCGFTGGARFVLIKRTDSTGDWYVWDTARGIVSGNDPYLLLNSTAAEVTNTDYVDTYSAGFEISSTAPAAINASGGTFIFLAIA